MFVAELNIDEGHVMQLVDMGFPLEACKKAVYNTRNNGIEVAMNWIMEHMDDPGTVARHSQNLYSIGYEELRLWLENVRKQSIALNVECSMWW